MLSIGRTGGTAARGRTSASGEGRRGRRCRGATSLSASSRRQVQRAIVAAVVGRAVLMEIDRWLGTAGVTRRRSWRCHG